jgi:hypothetical protein
MTRDDIDDLMRDNGIVVVGEAVYALCQIVAAREREACAKVCDEKVDAEYATGKVDHNEMGWTQACAIAIRARGER